MAPISTHAKRSQEVRTLDQIRPAAVKATGERSDAVRLADAPGPSFCSSMGDAIVSHYGTVKEAAFRLGQCDPSLMQREFDAGKFGRFDQHATQDDKAAVLERMTEVFRTLTTPAAFTRHATRVIRQQCDLIDQFSEFIR